MYRPYETLGSKTEKRPILLILSPRRDRDLPKFPRDRDETKTFDFGSETKTETFVKTLHTNAPDVCLNDDEQFNSRI